MELHDILTALRKERGLSQREVADYCAAHKCPITQKAVSKWERGTSCPDARQFLLLCALYDVGDLTLFGVGHTALNELGRQRMLEYLRLLQGSERYLCASRPVFLRSIPLYDLPASAGTGLFLDSEHYELIQVGEEVPLCATFAVRIRGDSMVPRFLDGQRVYVKQQQRLERGELGIFLLNGDVYCKQLGDGALISLNKKYAPIALGETDELRVIGKVVYPLGDV